MKSCRVVWKGEFKMQDEITRQDITDIYELTYKYQMLKQEAALGGYGVPTILSDAAYMEFEKIKGELSQKLDTAYDRLTSVYRDWIYHHQAGAEEDLSNSTYDDVLEQISSASDYSDLLNIFSEDELREVLVKEVKEHISVASEYEDTDYAALDPDSMTFAELTALPFVAPGGTYHQGFFDDLVSTLERHPAVDDIVNERMDADRYDFFNSSELASVMNMSDELENEWEKLPEGLDTDILLFQKALNIAHNNGSMAEYILEERGVPDREAKDFLSDLSENPEHAEKWDKEVSRLLGYPVRTRIVPKDDWFVSSRLKIAIQALVRYIAMSRIPKLPEMRIEAHGENVTTDNQERSKVDKDIYLERLDFGIDTPGLEIWRVDEGKVRDRLYTDFTIGGHDRVYSFIPEGQVWIGDDVDIDELYDDLLHELWERFFMGEGVSYEDAHEMATGLEQDERSHPEETLDKLERALELNISKG
jgi:hypothetical protein